MQHPSAGHSLLLLGSHWKLVTLSSLCTLSLASPLYASNEITNSPAKQTKKHTLSQIGPLQFETTDQRQCDSFLESSAIENSTKCKRNTTKGNIFTVSPAGSILSSLGINPWVLLGGAGAGIAAAAAGGGGGGGGGGGSSSNNNSSTDSNESTDGGAPFGTIPTQPAYYRTTEYLARQDLDVIKAKEAYANIASLEGANGATQGGKGIVIAILDTGVDTAHSDLKNNVQTGCASSASCNTHYASTDADTHGTHVAGIAAGSKNADNIHGVAFNATILPGCAYIGGGCYSSPVSDAELMLWSANHGATVANMSYAYTSGNRTLIASDVTGGVTNYSDSRLKNYLFGGYSSNSSSDYQQARQALKQGLVTVLAAGNYQYWITGSIPEVSQPSVMAMAPLIYKDTGLASDLDYQWISVVNTNLDGTLASSSHACGDSAEFCLAAPGTSITSTVPGNKYDEKTGTSMAAPQVSGAVALVAGAFPTLTLPSDNKHASYCDSGSASYNSKQCHSKAVVNRLFTTATDMGASGVDPVYGQGLLNLDSATSLIGEAQIQTSSGTVYNLADSSLNTSTAAGRSISKQLASVRFIATDSYDNAGFLFTGENLLGTSDESANRIDTLRYMNRSMYSDALSTTTISPGLTLTYSQASNQIELLSGSYQLTHSLSPVSEVNIGYGLGAQQNFIPGHNSPINQDRLISSQAFSSPFSNFNESAHSVGYQKLIAGEYTFNVSFQQGHVTEGFNHEKDSLKTSNLTIALSSSITDDLKGSLQFGGLYEEESVLGSHGSGVWSTTDGSQSFMAGINLNYQLTPSLDALFSYYRLATESVQNQSALEYSDDILSDSFSMGLLASHEESSWKYGLFITQPLRINNGNAQLELPSGYNGYHLTYNAMDIDLAPDGRHLEYEFAIGWEPESIPLSSKINLIRIEDYGNIAGNNDTIMLLSLGIKF